MAACGVEVNQAAMDDYSSSAVFASSVMLTIWAGEVALGRIIRWTGGAAAPTAPVAPAPATGAAAGAAEWRWNGSGDKEQNGNALGKSNISLINIDAG